VAENALMKGRRGSEFIQLLVFSVSNGNNREPGSAAESPSLHGSGEV
jgi:hypothetical protein